MHPAPEATIGAGDFKATCLKLLYEVAGSRRPLVFTKHCKAAARLVPMPPHAKLFGALAGNVLQGADLLAPIDTEWDVDR